MTGQIFTVSEKREHPPAAFLLSWLALNAQKAMACIRFSSLENVEYHIISYPEENQTLEFCRLNPNMPIPVLEVDDCIITDSRDIQRYLTEHYPGKGDAEANKEDMNGFIDTVCSWDEYLYSYRNLPATLGELMHTIRLVCLVDAVNQAINDGKLDETLRDGQTIHQAYVKKIAQTRALVNVGVGEETPDLKRRMGENGGCLENIHLSASISTVGKVWRTTLVGPES